MTSDSKRRADKKQKTDEDETVVFQKSRYKILTYINPFEQNNDHTRISYEIEFCSFFKHIINKENKEIWIKKNIKKILDEFLVLC